MEDDEYNWDTAQPAEAPEVEPLPKAKKPVGTKFTKSCWYCKKTGLGWGKDANRKWALIEQDGSLHQCKKAE